MEFDYQELVSRNIGFVTEEEQGRLRQGTVFVCGVGGMGGACLMSLVRAGVGKVVMADIDDFELSNLNRQLFANLETVGLPKVEATCRQVQAVNPEIEIETYGDEWTDRLDDILQSTSVVVNGMDDIACGIHLYRRARVQGATVIDAYASPLPSVTVVRPEDPRPEERLALPTLGKPWTEISQEDVDTCLMREVEYVMTHSSSRHLIDLEIAAELVAGRRARPSFATMVITTGNLMAYEAINLLLGNSSATDYRGYFFNPWTGRTERPRWPVSAAILGLFVRRYLAALLKEA